MAARPSWEGHLRLSLVACPVSLWSATTTAETVRFNLINPKTNNRVRMKTVDAGTGEELSRGDLVKGFAVGRTIHGDVGRAWMAGEVDDATAIATMADNFRRLVTVWDEARAAAGVSA